MELSTAFNALHKFYGTHSGAARAIKISIPYYRDLRNGRVSIPPRTAEYIIMKAEEASLEAIARSREAVSV